MNVFSNKRVICKRKKRPKLKSGICKIERIPKKTSNALHEIINSNKLEEDTVNIDNATNINSPMHEVLSSNQPQVDVMESTAALKICNNFSMKCKKSRKRKLQEGHGVPSQLHGNIHGSNLSNNLCVLMPKCCKVPCFHEKAVDLFISDKKDEVNNSSDNIEKETKKYTEGCSTRSKSVVITELDMNSTFESSFVGSSNEDIDILNDTSVENIAMSHMIENNFEDADNTNRDDESSVFNVDCKQDISEDIQTPLFNENIMTNFSDRNNSQFGYLESDSDSEEIAKSSYKSSIVKEPQENKHDKLNHCNEFRKSHSASEETSVVCDRLSNIHFHDCLTYTRITGYCIIGKTRKKILVSMKPGDQLVLDGCYCIKPVIGCVKVLGYPVEQGEKRPVFSPSHRAMIPVMNYFSYGLGDSDCDDASGDVDTIPFYSSGFKSTKVKKCKSGILMQKSVDFFMKQYKLDCSHINSLKLKVGHQLAVLEISSFSSKLNEVLFYCKENSLLMNLPPLDHDKNASLLPDAHNSLKLACDSNLQSSYLKYKQHNTQPPSLINQHEQENNIGSTDKKTLDICDVKEWYDVLNGAKPIIKQEENGTVIIPDSWQKHLIVQVMLHQRNLVAKTLCAEMKNVTSMFGYTFRPKMRVIVIGEQNTGKSTFVKFLINSLLHKVRSTNTSLPQDCRQDTKLRKTQDSLQNRPKIITPSEEKEGICCMDLDPGQPEQSLPGVLSVGRYTRPLLGSAFTYSVATSKTKAEQIAKKKMIERRKKIYQHLQSMKDKCNYFDCTDNANNSGDVELEEMLEDADAVEDRIHYGEITKQLLLGDVSPCIKSAAYIDIVKDLMETVKSKHRTEPLVVNTMGWLSGQGMMFLAEIINIVEPTHVVHLCHEKSQVLDCQSMKMYVCSEKYTSGPTSPRNLNFEYDYFQVQSAALYQQSPNSKYSVNVRRSSKLRDLMFTAYFTALWPMDETRVRLSTCKQAVKLDINAFAIHHTEKYIDPGCALLAMKESLVALCRTDPINLSSSREPGVPRELLISKVSRSRGLLDTSVSAGQQNSGGDNNWSRESSRVCVPPKSYYSELIEKHTVNYTPVHHPWMMSSEEPPLKISGQKLLQSSRFQVLGWAIVVAVESNEHKLCLLSPIQEKLLPNVNVVVMTKIKLPDRLQEVLFESRR